VDAACGQKQSKGSGNLHKRGPSEKAGLIDCEVSHRLPKTEFFEGGQSIKRVKSI
jgi:hypothetical protein